MSKALNDNFRINKGAPADDRVINGTETYADLAAALAAIVLTRRYITLTVSIGTPAVEYWFREGIADGDLIVKDLAGGSLSEAPTEAFNANLTFDQFPSKDIQEFDMAADGNLDLTVSAAGNKRHASIVLKVIADGAGTVNFNGPRWSTDAMYSITNAEVLDAGTYWFYFMWDGTSAQVSVPGNAVEGGGGTVDHYKGEWNFAANGQALPIAWVPGDYGYAEDTRIVDPGDPSEDYVEAGYKIDRTPTGFKYT